MARHSLASRVLIGSSVLSILSLLAAPCAPGLDIHRPPVEHFVSRMVTEHGFDRRALNRLLRSARTQDAIIEAMNRPAEKSRLWYEYRQIFLTPKRIREGTEFWIAHREQLDKAYELTGVAPEFIVAILGVETLYGRQSGRYRVLDALSTLAFDYPPRSEFFASELEQFLLLSREARINPRSAIGSYAGAMGAPQFMPSSYRRYGVDASGDGRIDLWRNWLDIFASVGNYFKEHGWQSGEPAMAEARVDPLQSEGLDGRQLALTETVESLRAAGVQFDTILPPGAPAQIIAVDEPDGLNWRVGYRNFFVITRYNRSPLYAMAAIELAEAIKANVDGDWPLVLNDVPGAALIEALPR